MTLRTNSQTSIALELGTSHTSIFLSGEGIVLREPSVVSRVGGNMPFYGFKAKDMLGRAPEKTSVTRPLREGVIEDEDVAAEMLRYFLSRVFKTGTPRRLRAILTVPCGLSREEKASFEYVLNKCGISEAFFIEKALCSAYGMNLPIGGHDGYFAADIGAGTTDIAVISLGGIIDGCSISMGTEKMDDCVREYALDKYSLEIGQLTAERAREAIGSLFENDVSSLSVSGPDINTKIPRAALMEGRDVARAITPVYERIAEAILSVVNSCPPEIAALLLASGIYVGGGGAFVTGLDRFLSSRIGLPVFVPQDGLFSCILGAGKLLSDDALLNEILRQN